MAAHNRRRVGSVETRKLQLAGNTVSQTENPQAYDMGVTRTSSYLHCGLDAIFLTCLAGDFEPCKAMMTAVYEGYQEQADADESDWHSGGVLLDDGRVVRGGAGGYKLSVWYGDARAYMGDHIPNGVWLQFGPKWIAEHKGTWRRSVREFLGFLGYDSRMFAEIRIQTLDPCVDIPGHVADVDVYREAWVGRAKTGGVWFDLNTGETGTVYIGKRCSAIMMRSYNKSHEAEVTGDIEFWRDMWDGYTGPVVRYEWRVKTHAAGIRWQLADLTIENVNRLFAMVLDWGRITDPSSGDSNRRRWPVSRLWQSVIDAVTDWAGGMAEAVKRSYCKNYTLSRAALRSGIGTISSMVAKASHALGLDVPGDVGDLLAYAQSQGIGGRFDRDVGRKFAIMRAMA